MPPGQGSFQAHAGLLRLFLAHREAIIERIEALLNARRKPARYLQDRPLLSRQFEDCFFETTAVRPSGQLEAAYCAAGFLPRQVHDLHNDLIHPAEMMTRAFYCWQQTGWPGRNGRMHYAHTLFNLYLLRALQFLSLRLWDDGASSAAERLTEIQRVLDHLWKSSPDNQPLLIRDARWLIPLAQSLITDELAPYFEVAQRVTETLPEADALEIQKAHVRMLGGHLTSQIRYYSTKDAVPIGDPSIILRTRTSNALDFALLVQGLVALLKAYQCASECGDQPTRLALAGAILQAISADPELFLNRLGLLGAYCMIEHVFIAPDPEGHVAYSPLGQRHVQLLNEYRALIHRLSAPLRDDLPRFRPVHGGYSPFGIVFGLPSHLIEHMALKAIQHDAETRFSLEDVFDDRDPSPAKLAWVNGWRRLPHIGREVQRLYDYPQQFAEQIYRRIEREFTPRLPNTGPTTGRLYIAAAADPTRSAIPELPARYFASSEAPSDHAQLLAARREAHFLVSYQTPAGWMALKKELLTGILGAGRDARITRLPQHATQVLRLMCPDLVESGPP